MRSGAPWWQRGVVYQVYPRSFADSDGDGVGDLPGITGRLDHIAALGVDAIWLSPIFRSPMRDFGYDVADYRDVDPVFGTLEDADRLIAAAHERGIRVVLDFVPNHTSSDHEWFLDARSSRDSAHRDWYLWRDPGAGGGPPSDLLAQFGGPAWTLDEATGQYWYHSFLPGQPDLDWRNPAVRAAMHDNLRFWFDRGVDGFRVDVLWMIAKDDAPWRDGPVTDAPTGFGGDPHNALEHGDGPAMDERLRELRDVADEYPDRVLIGEVYMEPRRLARYYGPGGRGAHLPFNTALITLPWEAASIRAAVEAYEAALPADAWPNWVLGNHDQPRVATRLGAAQARVAAMLLLTLRGTPTLYYGDELGLPDVVVPPDRAVDVAGRDPERSPMPWTTGPNAGFTEGDPWLPVTDDPGRLSVEAQERAPGSMLALHRRLLALRRAEPALHLGSWTGLDAPAGVVAYERGHLGTQFLVLLNLTGDPTRVVLVGTWTIELSTGLDRKPGVPAGSTVDLRGAEGLVLRAAQTHR
jgi:alpha-glucosidase